MYRPLVCALVVLVALAASAQTASTPPLKNVVIIALENQSYEDVVGSPAMPYLNSLINQYALTESFYANSHGSISDYFMLTVGELVTVDAAYKEKITTNNVVRQISGMGKTWKAYAQSIPSAGYLGDSAYPYAKRHNPFAYFGEVINNPSQAARIVPLTQLSTDLSAGTLPNYAFIIADEWHNSHDCPGGGTNCANADKLAAADAFLQSIVPGILASPQMQRDALLVIWWDEGALSDNRFFGGRIAVVLAGPGIKRGYRSRTFWRHENLLRTTAEALGMPNYPGAAIYVSPMTEFFGTSTVPGTGTFGGTVTFIADGSAVTSATVTYTGGSTSVNGSGAYSFPSVAPATYNVTASAPGFFSQTKSVTVSSGSAATLNFALATGGKVAGTVRTSGGTAIANADVQITGGMIATNVAVKTNSTGAYNSNWIPIGNYTVKATAAGFLSKSASTSVTTGATSTVNFALTN